MTQDLPQTYRHPLPNGLCYDLALVRAGTFIMGSEGPDAFDDEKPEHRVRLTRDYYIGIYPVTQAVWKAVMDGHNFSHFIGDDRPVENVSWQDIVEGNQDGDGLPAFLDQLNDRFPAESGLRFRLPTEAEWEYAAKDGHHAALNDTEDLPKGSDIYTLYAGSDKLKEVGWYHRNSHEETKEVGLKAPNKLGVYDMSGNVFEWCHDLTHLLDDTYYSECYAKGIIGDPTGLTKARDRLLRGGGWGYDPQYCRVSYRFGFFPSLRASYIGFRLVLASPAE